MTSITISQQYELAWERVRAAGLEHLVDIQLRDYREIFGVYDAIVSIEMLEAVGPNTSRPSSIGATGRWPLVDA